MEVSSCMESYTELFIFKQCCINCCIPPVFAATAKEGCLVSCLDGWMLRYFSFFWDFFYDEFWNEAFLQVCWQLVACWSLQRNVKKEKKLYEGNRMWYAPDFINIYLKIITVWTEGAQLTCFVKYGRYAPYAGWRRK